MNNQSDQSPSNTSITEDQMKTVLRHIFNEYERTQVAESKTIGE